MDRSPHAAAVRTRAGLLWLAASAALAAAAVTGAGPASGLALAPASTFADLLVQACAAVALVAAGGLWLVTCEVALSVLRQPLGPPARRVGPLRALLLGLCGVAALGSTTPATAGDRGPELPPVPARLLVGLPLPDRATGAAPRPAADLTTDPAAPAALTGAVVRVRPGDSLWRLAARRLAPDASAADVATYTRRVHA
ncbi:MAG TPA: hypothetical protein VNS81_10055 [Nocardioides sp.]|nr:hypothetical protein [Nocardioides sp.]